jgi:arylamine N-acetyltransferase
MKSVGVWSDDGLPALSDAAVGDVLARVGVPARPPGVEALDELFRAWLYSSPFHNLGLLAGLDGLAPPVAVADAIQHAFSGRGGPCHVQAAGFATLVRALGYSASLLPATVKERDDHLVVGVTVGGTRLLCDVGNGHPYPGPFPFDRPAERSWWGWSFATGPTKEGFRLLRSLPDGGQRQVYVARWEPRRYDDFARIIAAHHGSVGFGPFMTGLRAVRFTPRGMLALRDTCYERHTPFGLTIRPVLDAEACRALLAGPFGLQDAPIERALAGLARHRDLFAETVGEECSPGAPSAALRVLFTVSTTDRPEGLRRLLRSLREALARDGVAEGAPVASRVEVLIVENSVRSEHRCENLRLVEAARADGLGVSMDDDGRYGRSIARSRVRQTELVARYAATRGAPACVWMIDDDVSFSTLSLRDGAELSEPSVGVVSSILKIRASHPQVSAAVGPVTGDAQVRPEAMLRVQTFDLVENLRRVADLAPDVPWCTPDLSALTAMPDYYYDHSRSGTAHLTTPCAWVPRAPSGTVRFELLAYLRACLAIPAGGHATRPLLAQAPHTPVDTSSPLRGGNAIFFDLDACLSHPYPCASLGDIDSRRSDMIGATLLARGGFTFARVPVGLQHVRVEAEDSQHTAASRWRSLRSEFHGVLLARLVMDGVPPGIDPAAHLKRVAEGRAQDIAEALRAAHEQLHRLDELRRTSRAWWAHDVEVTKALDRVASMLRAMWEQSVGSDAALPVSGRLTLLRQRLLDDGDLAAVLAAWRSTPGAIDAMREQMLGVRGGGR